MKKQLIFIIFILFTLSNAKAQKWGGGIDAKRFDINYIFKYTSSELKILKTPNWDNLSATTEVPDFKSISSPVSSGAGLGIPIRMRISEHTDLRFSPGVLFSTYKVNYTFKDPDIPTEFKEFNTSVAEFPLGLRLKSDRLNNVRAFMMGGLKYSFDWSSSKKNTNVDNVGINKNLLYKKNFLSYEAGLGMEIYFEYFKLSPEFKLSYSLNDMIKREGNAFDLPLERAKLRQFTFTLYIE